jgi:hypothetical protein
MRDLASRLLAKMSTLCICVTRSQGKEQEVCILSVSKYATTNDCPTENKVNISRNQTMIFRKLGETWKSLYK